MSPMWCTACIGDKPDGVRIKDWQDVEFGWTGLDNWKPSEHDGFAVWCRRCRKNVIRIEFTGHEVRIFRGPDERRIDKGFKETATTAAG